MKEIQIEEQLSPLEKTLDFKDGGDPGTTFKKNGQTSIHRWYSYVEGFSWIFVRKILQGHVKNSNFVVLDPFCGSGTTLVEASLSGIPSIGYDVNPFLTFVSSVKTNFSVNTDEINIELDKIREKTKKFRAKDIPSLNSLNLSTLFANDHVFGEKILPKVLFLKKCFNQIENNSIKNLFALSLCSIIIEISNYRRGPDLALKREKLVNAPVFERFFERISISVDDLKNLDSSNTIKPKIYTGDSRFLKKINENTADCVITSPPYLNGTNYFRNTKLELWFTEMLSSSEQLHDYREKAITAGICDVFKSKRRETNIPIVREIVKEISEIAYDSRIPVMVSTYFEEISTCFQNLFRVMKSNAKCYWVVGDSAFSKILVPTDDITVEIAEKIGFKHEKTDIVRDRTSRSGLALHESIITLKKM